MAESTLGIILLRVPDTQETTTGLDSTEEVLLMSAGNGDDVYEDTKHVIDAVKGRPYG
jgi:hypothetical protein